MFHFRLQSILEVRERLARIKQKEFSEVLSRHQALEEEIAQHHEDLSRAANYVDGVRRTSPSVLPLELYGNYRRRLDSEIALLGERMREQAQELEARRKSLVEAKRSQRTLEILRDKERVRYELTLKRREQATMDEVASNYFIFRGP
jgi:flagellar export protein FliJ